MSTSPRLSDAVVQEIRTLYADHRDLGDNGQPLDPFSIGKPITLAELKESIAGYLEREHDLHLHPRSIHDIVVGKRYASAPGPIFPTASMTTAAASTKEKTSTYLELIAATNVGRRARGTKVVRVVARVPLKGVYATRVVHLTDDQIDADGVPVLDVSPAETD